MRDGRLTFSLRETATHDNNRFNSVLNRVKSSGNRPVPSPVSVTPVLPVIDFSGSTGSPTKSMSWTGRGQLANGTLNGLFAGVYPMQSGKNRS